MSYPRFTPEFKNEAVRQVVDRGYSVADVAARGGVSTHSLHKWGKAAKPDKTEEQSAELVEAKREILKLRAELRDCGRVARPFGFALTDPSMRLSRTRLFPKVTRGICVARPRNE